MAASVGLFARRSWVFPTTTLAPAVGRRSPHWVGTAPSGRSIAVTEDDVHAVGTYQERQKWMFPHPAHPGREIEAKPVLIEPGGAFGPWENFEACLKTPEGHFLPGGYSIESIRTAGATPGADQMGRDFVTQGGFTSAINVLRWWSSTGRPGGFVRFMLWAAADWVRLSNNPNGTPRHEWYHFFWDRHGEPILREEFGTAHRDQKHLEVPGGEP